MVPEIEDVDLEDKDNSEVEEPEVEETEEEGAPEGGDNSEEEVDPEIAAVFAKFQNDPAKMAKSYAALQSKLGVLGQKAAIFDEMMASSAKQPEKAAPKKPATVEEIMAHAIEVNEKGGDGTVALVEALLGVIDAKLETAVRPVVQKTQALTVDQIEQQFVAKFPDAPKYAEEMTAVIKKFPALFSADNSTEENLEGLEMALERAKRMAGVKSAPAKAAARQPVGPTRKFGTVDTAGQSARQRPEAVAKGERKLFEKWREGKDETDLVALLKSRMAPSE